MWQRSGESNPVLQIRVRHRLPPSFLGFKTFTLPAIAFGSSSFAHHKRCSTFLSFFPWPCSYFFTASSLTNIYPAKHLPLFLVRKNIIVIHFCEEGCQATAVEPLRKVGHLVWHLAFNVNWIYQQFVFSTAHVIHSLFDKTLKSDFGVVLNKVHCLYPPFPKLNPWELKLTFQISSIVQ